MKKYFKMAAIAAAVFTLGACSSDDSDGWKSEWEEAPAPRLTGMYQVVKSENPNHEGASHEYGGAYQVYETDGYTYTYNFSDPLKGIREQYKQENNRMWWASVLAKGDEHMYIRFVDLNTFQTSNENHTNVTTYKKISDSRYPWGVWEYKYVFDPETEEWYYSSFDAPETPYCAMFQDKYYSFKTKGDPEELKLSMASAQSETKGTFKLEDASFSYEYGNFDEEVGLFIISKNTGMVWFLTRQYSTTNNFASQH